MEYSRGSQPVVRVPLVVRKQLLGGTQKVFKKSLNKNTLIKLKISRKIEHTTSILILKDGKNDTVADKRL
jgi:hypothetical protein